MSVPFTNPIGHSRGMSWFICGECIKEYEVENAGRVRKTELCDFCGKNTLVHVQLGSQLLASKEGAEKIRKLDRPHYMSEVVENDTIEEIRPTKKANLTLLTLG